MVGGSQPQPAARTALFVHLAMALAPQVLTVVGVLFLGWSMLSIALAGWGALAGLYFAALLAKRDPGEKAPPRIFLAIHAGGFLAAILLVLIGLLSPGATYDSDTGYHFEDAKLPAWWQFLGAAGVPLVVVLSQEMRQRFWPVGVAMPMPPVLRYYMRMVVLFIAVLLLTREGMSRTLAGYVLLAVLVATDLAGAFFTWLWQARKTAPTAAT